MLILTVLESGRNPVIGTAPDQTILRSDGLHPNSDGSQVLALLVAQALQGF